MKNSTSGNTHQNWLIIVALAVVLSACGSGGNSGNDNKNSNLSSTPGLGTGASGLGKGPTPVSLGWAGNYVILAASAISNVPSSSITGDIGLTPAAASFITGFSLITDASNVFSTSSQVSGNIFAANYATPTPTNLTTALSHMQMAYTDAAGRAPDYTELGAGNIGGMTLAPATYQWTSGVLIPTNVTLSGGPNDVWIFKIAQGITQASSAQVILSGGALPKNIFWQAFGVVDIGTAAHMEGIILSKTSITMRSGASVNGRLLAQTTVTLDSNAVTQPLP